GLVTGRDSWLEAVVVIPGPAGAGGQETAIEVNNLAVSPDGHWRARMRPTGDATPGLPAAGAPFFSGEFLVGVVTPPEDGRGLDVVPLAPLAADDGCQRAVQRSGRPLRPEPVELARSLRPWLPEYSWLPAALLRPEFEVIPFVGRDAIVDELTRWCLS